MKYFFDTEFIESSEGIELVSIGIISEEGKTFYAESREFDESKANQWVKDNVISKLHYHGHAPNGVRTEDSHGNISLYKFEHQIKEELLRWFKGDKEPIFYAYFASYDWVVFARIFGRLIDKPEHFPMWVIDLKQMMWERGLTKEWKQKVCPDPEDEHDALADARWNRSLHSLIVKEPPEFLPGS